MFKKISRFQLGFTPNDKSSGKIRDFRTGFTPNDKSSGKIRDFRTGFTFIEALVVMAIFAMVIVAIYAVFHAGIMVSRRSKDVGIQEKKVCLALERFARDIRGVCLIADTEMEELQFRADNRDLSFTAFTNEGLFHYNYYFDSINNRFVLKKNIIDREDKKLKKPQTRILCLDIEGVSFEFLEFDSEMDDYSWTDEWQEQEQLPLIVKAEISSGGLVYTKKVPIFR